jgi:hypothetical protein
MAHGRRISSHPRWRAEGESLRSAPVAQVSPRSLGAAGARAAQAAVRKGTEMAKLGARNTGHATLGTQHRAHNTGHETLGTRNSASGAECVGAWRTLPGITPPAGALARGSRLPCTGPKGSPPIAPRERLSQGVARPTDRARVMRAPLVRPGPHSACFTPRGPADQDNCARTSPASSSSEKGLGSNTAFSGMASSSDKAPSA